MKARRGPKLQPESMIEELAMEIEATAEHADSVEVNPAQRSEKLQKIRRAAVVLISVNNGLRKPSDAQNPKLVEIMGDVA